MSAALTQVTDNLIEFVGPILGFDDQRHYALSPLEPTGTLWSLSSTRTPELRFVVAAPQPFFPDYHPAVAEAAVAALGADPAELTVLVILTVDGSIRTATANLLAPVIVAPKQQRALQVILDDDTLAVRAPLQRAEAS